MGPILTTLPHPRTQTAHFVFIYRFNKLTGLDQGDPRGTRRGKEDQGCVCPGRRFRAVAITGSSAPLLYRKFSPNPLQEVHPHSKLEAWGRPVTSRGLKYGGISVVSSWWLDYQTLESIYTCFTITPNYIQVTLGYLDSISDMSPPPTPPSPYLDWHTVVELDPGNSS